MASKKLRQASIATSESKKDDKKATPNPRKMSMDSKLTHHSSSETINTNKDNDLSPEALEEIREVFKLFDLDNDGTISSKELGVVMKALGQNPTEAELLDIVTEVDKDANGLIDFEEFVDVMKGIMTECDNEDDIKGAFRVFDKEGKGFITAEDLKETITSLGEKFGEEEYDEMISAADLDGDGQVTINDFLELMMPTRYK
ncbi:unnamed protein product [Ceutorhynchus assimilis]|uniref:EF-hand domain-containing protein n=1 Tax=Ceutorhynchus assimilis TaxID=467358 RepID=A0A9N9MGY1_9CUCU|nr:unnamed protein product [Ceutorhynchus assimilis]